MKTIKFVALFVAAALMSFTASDSYTPAVMTELGDNAQAESEPAFQHGERLTYKIYYNLNFIWVPAGEVTFKVFDEGPQYHYQAKGFTYDSYEWFFTVKDDYDSWVDKGSYYPNYSERSVNEGGYHIFEKIAFNQSAQKMTVWRSSKRGAEETKTEHAVKEKVHDVLSSLYFLRNFDVSNQQSGYAIPFRVFMDKEEFPLRLRFAGRDSNKKVHNMGRYRTLKFHPDVIAGNVFTEDAKMSVWVSDDQNKIPLMIESPVSVGSVKMVIKEYWGLKYPFGAKVD